MWVFLILEQLKLRTKSGETHWHKGLLQKANLEVFVTLNKKTPKRTEKVSLLFYYMFIDLGQNIRSACSIQEKNS